MCASCGSPPLGCRVAAHGSCCSGASACGAGDAEASPRCHRFVMRRPLAGYATCAVSHTQPRTGTGGREAVFDKLIESKRKKNRGRSAWVGGVSLVTHTVVIGAAVIATLNAGQSDNSVKVDTAMVFVDQPKQEKPPEQQPVQLDVPLKGFQTVVAPDVIPTNIPPVNLQEHFDPKDYSGTGVEGGVATGITPTGNEVFMEAVVEEKPAVLSGPALQYPQLLAQAQIQGRVVVEAIVDTLGRAEANSVKVRQSANPGFDQPAKNYVLKCLFRPARVHGRAVRVLIQLPIDFRIKQ